MLFQIFKGQFTKSTGQKKCKSENLKLIEIRNNQQLWLFSTLLNNKNIETPMGGYFDQESGNFLFDSDGTPFNSGPVKNSTGGSALLSRYDKMIYRNHHLSYVFDKGHVYFQLNLSIFRKYSSIIYIPTDMKSKTDLEKVCERDVKMSKDMVTESRYLVHSYQNSLKLLNGNHEQHIQRGKRGALALLGMGGFAGAVVAGVLPSLFGSYLDTSELESKSRELEATLGSLETRMNILDKNQQYLAKKLNETILFINSKPLKDEIQDYRIYMNSVYGKLIQQLNILYRVTGNPVHSRAYQLSLSIEEISKILAEKFQVTEFIRDQNIQYQFQTTPQGALYIIIKILVSNNKMKIKEFISVDPFPRVNNSQMTVKDSGLTGAFLYLSGGHYVEVSKAWMVRCQRDPANCFSNEIPKKCLEGGALV